MSDVIWKPISGFEGLYEVSNHGDVRSLTRYIKHDYFMQKRKGMTIRQSTSKTGYKRVTLTKNGKPHYFNVHRLVAQAFIPNPNNFSQVNHKNENKNDNRVGNLEWCTQAYNNAYGTRMKRVIEANKIAQASKPVCQYNDAGEIVHKWRSLREIERETKFSRKHVADCCKGKVKTAYGFTWKFDTTGAANGARVL